MSLNKPEHIPVSIPVSISISINGVSLTLASGVSVAAALAISGNAVTRHSLSGQPRAPLCGMGVCQECRVTVNGRPHQLACQTVCQDGMRITCREHA